MNGENFMDFCFSDVLTIIKWFKWKHAKLSFTSTQQHSEKVTKNKPLISHRNFLLN